MKPARLPLSFSIDPNSTLDTLEMVLAIARRIGLHLAQLELRGAGRVFIELRAGDDDALALFCARLHNVIGVDEVCMLPIEQKEWTLRRSPDLQPEPRPCT
jgi:acetolactate synthase regulatory subunit